MVQSGFHSPKQNNLRIDMCAFQTGNGAAVHISVESMNFAKKLLSSTKCSKLPRTETRLIIATEDYGSTKTSNTNQILMLCDRRYSPECQLAPAAESTNMEGGNQTMESLSLGPNAVHALLGDSSTALVPYRQDPLQKKRDRNAVDQDSKMNPPSCMHILRKSFKKPDNAVSKIEANSLKKRKKLVSSTVTTATPLKILIMISNRIKSLLYCWDRIYLMLGANIQMRLSSG